MQTITKLALASACALAATGAVAADTASTKAKSAAQEAKTQAYEILDKDITTVKFNAGSAELSDAERSSLKALVDAHKGQKVVESFVVAAWSGEEYPATKEANLPKEARDLAERRKEAVQSYLKEVGAKNVDAYNMAEHPMWISKVFRTQEAKVKGEEQNKVVIGKDDAEDREIAAIGQKLRARGGPNTAVVILKRDVDVLSH